jgi:hemolysin activation/secretion protein
MLSFRITKSLCKVLVLLGSAAGVAQAQEARFDILEYRVEGNSLMAAEQIEQALTPHVGLALSLKDVEAARASLEQRYHDAGYLTVQVSIPEQNVDSGEVSLQVTEAPVGKLRVLGAQYHLPSKIKASVDEVAEGRVPNFLALQQRLSEVNKSADLKVAPVLKPGKVPGTVEVQLEVDDQLPLHGSVELSNRQSANTSATRLAANLRYDDLWQSGHSLGLGLQTSPENPRETQVLSANYLWPLGAGGDALTVYGVVSRSEFATLYNAPGLGVLGNSEILGLRYALPLAGEPSYVQSFTLGLDHKTIKQSISLSGLSTDNPDLQYVPLTLGYRGVWPGDLPQATAFDVNAILGLRGLLGNSDAAFDSKRAGASASFTALRSGLQLSRAAGPAVVAAKLEWQLASGPLLPSEQFVAGGADSVRGYLEGERAGDEALRFSFELSSPPVTLASTRGLWTLTGLVFFDEAQLRTLQAGVGQQATVNLAGAGLGLRLQGPGGLGLQLDAAQALTDGDVAGGGTRAGDWRLHGRLNLEF